MRIAVENSTWNNIGDAFYQLPLENMFKALFREHDIVPFDGPLRRAFRPGRFHKNCLDSRYMVAADHYIFSGPILAQRFFDDYAPFIEKLTRDGKSYSLLSVHSGAQGELLERLRNFVAKYPPLAFHTRSETTYSKFQSVVENSYNGICFAFMISRYVKTPDLGSSQPFFVSSFYAGPEPRFSIERDTGDDEFPLNNLSVLPRPSRYWRIARHLDFKRSYPDEVGGYKIVRPVHGFYPFSHLIFARPNSYITYNPQIMLGVYAACKAVISDRIHSGIAGLSFGKPVSISKLDSRYDIFLRAPVTKRGDFFFLDEPRLNNEHDDLCEWLRKIYGS